MPIAASRFRRQWTLRWLGRHRFVTGQARSYGTVTKRTLSVRLPVGIAAPTAAYSRAGSQITGTAAPNTIPTATKISCTAAASPGGPGGKVPIRTEPIRKVIVPQRSSRVLEARVGLWRHREWTRGYFENIRTSWCRVGELEVRRRYAIAAFGAETLWRWLLLLAEAGSTAQAPTVSDATVNVERLLLVRVRRLISVYR